MRDKMTNETKKQQNQTRLSILQKKVVDETLTSLDRFELWLRRGGLI